jgi:hypothetical protein
MGETLKNCYWAVGTCGYLVLITTCLRILWITRNM